MAHSIRPNGVGDYALWCDGVRTQPFVPWMVAKLADVDPVVCPVCGVAVKQFPDEREAKPYKPVKEYRTSAAAYVALAFVLFAVCLR